jgi:hypothetical protein
VDRTVYIISTCEWGWPTDWKPLSQCRCRNCSCGTRSVFSTLPQKKGSSVYFFKINIIHIHTLHNSCAYNKSPTFWYFDALRHLICRRRRKLKVSAHVLFCIFHIRWTIILTEKNFQNFHAYSEDENRYYKWFNSSGICLRAGAVFCLYIQGLWFRLYGSWRFRQ